MAIVAAVAPAAFVLSTSVGDCAVELGNVGHGNRDRSRVAGMGRCEKRAVFLLSRGAALRDISTWPKRGVRDSQRCCQLT